MMNLERNRPSRSVRAAVAIVCAMAIAPGNAMASAVFPARAFAQAPAQEAATTIPANQLDSLVAPIALYPDPLLAQILAASTYPLELLQLQQWLEKNPGLKDKALLDAVGKQPWDPSIQAMAPLPDVVKRLANDIQWTTDLGNAFLAQQGDVMEAVQRMRKRAQDKGNLKSTPQQTVETQVIEQEQVIVIEQSDPEVVYIPSYNPYTVWGDPFYPYPPIYYPPPGYYAAGAAISFGVGVAIGAAWGNGGWGWGPRWGNNDITINNNNIVNRNANVRAGNRNVSGRTNWQHRPEHRGGTPYRDRSTANRYGGTARGDSLANRQASARQQVQRQGGNVRSGAVGTTGTGTRAGAGNVGSRTGSVGDRASASPRSSVSSSGLSSRSTGGGADRVGSHDLSRSRSSASSHGGFSGSGGFNGSHARSSSSRGSSSSRSMSRPSGGFGGGGGGRSRGGGRR
jgi:hypothetical protein